MNLSKGSIAIHFAMFPFYLYISGIFLYNDIWAIML